VCHKISNAPVLRSGTGSWVLSALSDARHPLSPVIRLGLQNPRKKERKKERNMLLIVSDGDDSTKGCKSLFENLGSEENNFSECLAPN